MVHSRNILFLTILKLSHNGQNFNFHIIHWSINFTLYTIQKISHYRPLQNFSFQTIKEFSHFTPLKIFYILDYSRILKFWIGYWILLVLPCLTKSISKKIPSLKSYLCNFYKIAMSIIIGPP